MPTRLDEGRAGGLRTAALFASLLMLACGSRSERGSPVAPSSLPSESAFSQACAVTPSDAAGPVTDPNGPYFHQVVMARTSDGVNLRQGRIVLDHASVPDGVRLRDGSVRIYYVNGADGSVWVARVDGDSVRPVGPITLNGIARPRGTVDPDATLLPDGRVRLVYLNGFGSPTSSSRRAICVADSLDGENFGVIDAAIEFQAGDTLTTDPSIVQLPTGGWLMAMSRGQTTVLARSSNGVAFSAGETLTYGGVPELALTSDGRVRLYVCARGIDTYVSSDGGGSWRREGTVGPRLTTTGYMMCDPSLVAGTDVFLYKTAD